MLRRMAHAATVHGRLGRAPSGSPAVVEDPCQQADPCLLAGVAHSSQGSLNLQFPEPQM
jgi:hypothetical protein